MKGKMKVDREALEARAAAPGVSVRELLAQMIALGAAVVELSPDDAADLDRQWAAIKAGEPTVAHVDVVRWFGTWGTSDFPPWNDR